MKKLLTFLTLLTLFFGVGWAAEVTETYTFSSVSEVTTNNGVTISFAKGESGNAPAWNSGSSEVRIYAGSGSNGSVISFSSTNNIKKIVLNRGSSCTWGVFTASSGSVSDNNSAATWEGEDTEVSLTLTGYKLSDNSASATQYRIKSVTITTETGGGTTAAATPTFSPGTGTYSGTQTVTISSSTSDATIYYTTDGSDPTTSSASLANGGTVTVSSSLTLKAIAAGTGYTTSEIGSATYTIVPTLYLIGNSWNGASDWDVSTGSLMSYDSSTGRYSTTIYMDQTNNYFQFAQGLGSSASDWGGLTNRIYPSTSWGTNVDVNTYDMDGSVPLSLSNSDTNASFWAPAGIYTISVDLTNLQCYVEQKEINVTITPDGGDVNLNSSATVSSSNLYSLLHGIKSSITQSDITYATSTDGNNYTDGATYQFTNAGTVILYGKAYYNEIAATVSKTFNVSSTANDEYELVTSADDLDEEGEYIIMSASSGSGYALSTTQNTNNRGRTSSIAITNNKINATDDSQVFTLEAATSGWYFYNVNGEQAGKYLYAISGNNYLRSGTDKSDDYVANISINESSYVATIEFQTSTKRYLKHNNNSSIFSCYTSGQQEVYLFKKVTNSAVSTKPTITPSTQYVKGGLLENVTISAASGATIYYTIDGNDPTTSSSVYSGAFNLPESGYATGGQTITVKAIAVESGKEASAVASATYTFQAPSDPTFTPSATAQTSDFTCEISSSDGGNIYYLLDPATAPTNAAEVISAGQAYTNGFAVSGNGTHTVYAAVELNGITSWAQKTYTITAPTVLTASTFERINSTDDLEVGKNYLIVCESASGAMGTIMNSTYRSIVSSGITLSNGIATVSDGCAASVFVLGGSSSGYTFNDGAYFLANTSGSQLNSVSSNSEGTAKWTISFTGDNAVITNYTNTGKSISYNSSYQDFYTGSGTSVQLYKEVTNAVQPPVITPEGGTFLNSQYPNGITVTVTPVTEGSTIYVSTDGTNYTPYTAATTLTITETTTVSAYATKDDVTSETVSETYNLVDVILEDVQFSPIPGTYSGSQTLQMYTTNQNAKIYYTTDGTTPSATNGTLYSGEIAMAAGNVYNFKAVAVLGNNTSDVAEGTYTINTASTSGLNSIAAIDDAEVSSSKLTMNNPIQVIYMSTFRHNGTVPEYAYVRDNSGYGLVYFGNGWYNTWADHVSNAKICEMGDWIPGGVVKGAVQLWSDGFHNEIGGKNNATTVTGWPTASDQLQNSPIIPEEMTNANINAGWDISNTFATEFNAAYQEYLDNNNITEPTEAQNNAANAYAIEKVGGYSSHIQSNNVWGHYVHLRKNTIEVTNEANAADATDGTTSGTGTRHKYEGFITDQSGEQLVYYDGFYNFSGYANTPDYNNDFFQNIQDNGGTFDVYGVVGFYGPYAASEDHNYIPFEVIPIDFLYIYKPTFNITSGTYYDTQEVTLSCATEGATIWYKTSDMEDYVEYTGDPISVDATTTIEAYSSIPTKYNDIMESVVNSLIINMGDIPQPVISPESGVFTIGEDEPVDATIAFESGVTVPDGTTIYFTVDGSDPKDENSNRYEYTAENIAQYLTDIEQTTTVRAIAYLVDDARQTSYYSREAEAKTYTFVKTNGIIYTLVTDQTQLNESSVYVIVNKANHMAMSVAQNDNNRGATGVKFVDEATKTQVEGNGDVALFMLTKIGNKWYIKTNNSDANGYLAVGDGNLLLTNAAADDNAEATITIDADAEHQAHISFAYNNALTRYLRYWLGGQAFSTYTSETSNLPVSLYYLAATPLANIEKEGTIENGKNQYTIADQLIGVWADATHGVLWCKDQGDASIDKTYIKDGQVDFMKHSGVQAGEWDQSNWVALQFTTPNSSNNIDLLVSSAVGKYIKQATVQGYYVDDVNFTIRMAEDKLELVEPGEVEYTKNVYCTTNFLPENLNIWGTDEDGGYTIGNDQNYFFMNPKIQEVCHITWAQWDKAKGWFTVPTASGFDGAFQVGWMYNQGGNISNLLRDEVQYEFDAIVQRASKTAYGPKDKVTTPNSGITVLPLNLSENSIVPVTAINTVSVNGEVKSVKYVNVAGVVSDKPFSGVNIVVTEYTDGSRSTTKMLRK